MFSDRQVPCNGCIACCRGFGRQCKLEPDDDWRAYDIDWIDGDPHLATRLDGTCVYLERGKCQIYDDRPLVCRRFDCRDYARHPIDAVHVAAEMRR